MSEHVLFVVGNYPPHIGGVELHVHRLATELVRQGTRVTVVTTDTRKSVERADEDGVSVIRIPGRFAVGDVITFPGLGSTRRLARYCRDHGVTVLSTHTRFFPMSFVGARAAKRSGVRHLHTEHGSDHVRGVGVFVGAASRLVDHTVGRWVLRTADAVLAVSDRVQAFVKRLSGRTALIFPNAIDVEPWLAVRGTQGKTPRRVVFLGRLVPGKGWEDFVEMCSILVLRGFEFEGHIVGDGIDRGAVLEASTARDLAERVRVRGRLQGDALHAAMADATLVNPTRLAEGFQTSLIEAVAAGGDVITYPIAGAETLRAAGAPVRIVEESTPAALADAVMHGDIGARFPREALRAWDWKTRAADYLAIARVMTERD